MSFLGPIARRANRVRWDLAFELVRNGPRERLLADFEYWAARVGTVTVLRALGAEIGEGSTVERWFKVQNASNGSCANLRIGEGVYVGPDVLVDLAQSIEIGGAVAIAGRVSIITHQSMHGALATRYPRREGAVRIGRGSFIGFGATICQGVTVGEEAVVGAAALVLRDVPPGVVVVGVPARPSTT